MCKFISDQILSFFVILLHSLSMFLFYFELFCCSTAKQFSFKFIQFQCFCLLFPSCPIFLISHNHQTDANQIRKPRSLWPATNCNLTNFYQIFSPTFMSTQTTEKSAPTARNPQIQIIYPSIPRDSPIPFLPISGPSAAVPLMFPGCCFG